MRSKHKLLARLAIRKVNKLSVVQVCYNITIFIGSIDPEYM